MPLFPAFLKLANRRLLVVAHLLFSALPLCSLRLCGKFFSSSRHSSLATRHFAQPLVHARSY